MHNLSEAERIALVAENTDNMVVITDTERKIVWVNQAYTIITGYSLEEIIGRPAGFVQFENTDPETVNEIREKLDKHLPIERELLNRAKDGKQYWVRLSISPVYKENRFVGFISVERDITEEKALVERLALSELNYRAFFNSSQDRLVFLDNDYRLMAFNTAAASNFKKNFGLEIKEGADFRDYISTPDQYLLLQKGIVPAFQGQPVAFEASTAMPDGSMPWFRFRCVPVYGENNKIIGVGISWSDITVEKTLLKENQGAAIKYKAILDSTEDRHILMDNKGVVLAFNKSAAEKVSKSVGKPLTEGIDLLDYLKDFEEVFCLNKGMEAALNNKPHFCQRKEEETGLWLKISYYPVHASDSNEIIGVSLNWSDITAEKIAEEQVDRHVKQLEEFSHITSHKLRQPLANIIGLTNLIANNETSAEEKQEMLGKLKTVADGLDTVIKEMTEAVAVKSFGQKHTVSGNKPFASGSVYIIDDDPVNNIITRRLLERNIKNISVKEFLNPAVALSELQNGTLPDLILLDINMSPMDGWGFLREFEKLNLNVTVVMCSSSVDPADYSRAQQHPLIAEFLSKPLTAEHIKNLLKKQAI
jgi:PAS domain S-box-containing protein